MSLDEKFCRENIYSMLEKFVEEGSCEYLDEVIIKLLECPEWSLISTLLSYASLCDKLPKNVMRIYSAIRLFIETLDCEDLRKDFKLTCYSAKRLIYELEPRMKNVKPGEKELLEKILKEMNREKLLHAICKAFGIISYPGKPL